jgi:hypothetical protein
MWIGSFYFILFYFPLAYFASRYSYDSNNNLSRSTRRTDGGQSWKNVKRIVLVPTAGTKYEPTGTFLVIQYVVRTAFEMEKYYVLVRKQPKHALSLVARVP